MLDYQTYLHTKLYLIEGIARKGTLNGDPRMKEILELCIASPSKIEKIVNDIQKQKD